MKNVTSEEANHIPRKRKFKHTLHFYKLMIIPYNKKNMNFLFDFPTIESMNSKATRVIK